MNPVARNSFFAFGKPPVSRRDCLKPSRGIHSLAFHFYPRCWCPHQQHIFSQYLTNYVIPMFNDGNIWFD